MSKYVNQFAIVKTVLAAAVTNGNTFTVAYPAGTTQDTFSNGLAGAAHQMIVNDNDRWAANKFSLAFGASLITVTNSTGITLPAGAAITLQLDQQDGNNVVDLAFKINLATITGAQDVVTDFSPGVDGTIESVFFVVDQPVTTGSKLASLNVEIGTTDLTGGVVALTSAAATPMGKVIAGTAITGNNVLTQASKISIEASAVTAFVEGSGELHVRIRRTLSNMY